MSVSEIAKAYFDELKASVDALDVSDVEKIADVLMDAYAHNRRIFILGNGGSASTASHMACDIGKGAVADLHHSAEKRFQVIALTDNVATLTAFANDLSFEEVFSQQLDNYLQPGDVVIGISASGNSPNIIKALSHAKEKGAVTVGLLGFVTGGKAKSVADYSIVVQSKRYGIVEDVHLALNHLLAACLKKMKEEHDRR